MTNEKEYMQGWDLIMQSLQRNQLICPKCIRLLFHPKSKDKPLKSLQKQEAWK